MEVKVFNNYETLSEYAAQIIIHQVRENPQSVLGLATGSSPLGLYNELIKDHKKNKTSYKEVLTFNLDEYDGIDKQNPHSYYHFMQENLFKDIDIALSNIHIPNGTSHNIEIECSRYNESLKNHPIDIQILGIGRNGHIGFNEPGTSFESTTHQIRLDEKTRKDNARFFKNINEVPTYAVTMGIQNILASKKIILIATGSSKADAVYQTVKGKINPSVPASALQLHPKVLLLVDNAAAKKLLIDQHEQNQQFNQLSFA